MVKVQTKTIQEVASADVPTSAAGEHNLFIDSSDNTLKTKDSTGTINGIGANVDNVTIDKNVNGEIEIKESAITNLNKIYQDSTLKSTTSTSSTLLNSISIPANDIKNSTNRIKIKSLVIGGGYQGAGEGIFYIKQNGTIIKTIDMASYENTSSSYNVPHTIPIETEFYINNIDNTIINTFEVWGQNGTSGTIDEVICDRLIIETFD